jgi:peptide/nickel transport system ATP-binding protein
MEEKKVIWITGASSGIGKALAIKFAENGWLVAASARRENLLNELKEDFGFTYIFISHDLAVVKYMADQLLVMNKGTIEEIGDADEIYANPVKQYTKKLIDSIPKGI